MWQKSLYYSLDSVKCVIALVSGGYLSSVVCQEEFNIAMYRCHQTVSIMIDYSLFYVLLKNFSLIWRRHRWRAAKFRPMLPLSREGCLSCHTCCDTGLRFFRSHTKDRLIQSPLTTHKWMWRIYSNPDPLGSPFNRLLRLTRGCRGPILTRILTGSEYIV
jgi:hypothetical protein